MSPKLNEQFLTGSGSVSIRYFLALCESHRYFEVLVIRYSGVYPSGSGGNGDATYMHAMAKAAVAAYEPWGVIHDFSELQYEWGDRLEMVFGVGPEGAPAPIAVVVGPGCEEAIRTLCLGVNSVETIDTIDGMFSDLPTAWQYISTRVGDRQI